MTPGGNFWTLLTQGIWKVLHAVLHNGTSPFGAEGFNPEGVRIGQEGSRHRRAVKVWDKREYKNLDDSVELAPATSRSPCAACANGSAKAPPKN